VDGEAKRRILRELGGMKEESYDRLVHMFVTQFWDKEKALKNALGNGDKEKAADIAHSVKGTAANLRLDAVKEAAKDLEIVIKSGRDTVQYLEKLDAEIRKL